MESREQKISDAIETLMGRVSVTLYAAFSEMGDIWPTTIRRTLADAVQALKQEPTVDPARPFDGGVRIGRFEFRGSPITGWNWQLPQSISVTYIPAAEVPQ